MEKDKELIYESEPVIDDGEGKLKPHELTMLDFEERKALNDVYESLKSGEAKSEIKKDESGNPVELNIISNKDGGILHFIDLRRFNNIVDGVMKVREIVEATKEAGKEAQKLPKEKWN